MHYDNAKLVGLRRSVYRLAIFTVRSQLHQQIHIVHTDAGRGQEKWGYSATTEHNTGNRRDSR